MALLDLALRRGRPMRRLQGIAVSGGSRIGRAVHHEAVAFDGRAPRRWRPTRSRAELERLARAAAETERGLGGVAARAGARPEGRLHLRGPPPPPRGGARRARGRGPSRRVRRARRRRPSCAATRTASPSSRTRCSPSAGRTCSTSSAASSARSPAARRPSLPAGDGRSPRRARRRGPHSVRDGGARRRTASRALVLEHGGPTSHTAIIAKALGLPCVVGVPGVVRRRRRAPSSGWTGRPGSSWSSPTRRTRAEAARRAASVRGARAEPARREPPARRDARRPRGHAARRTSSSRSRWRPRSTRGAAGIGLYRTEFLFDPARPVPDEAEHLAAYREALARIRPGAADHPHASTSGATRRRPAAPRPSRTPPSAAARSAGASRIRRSSARSCARVLRVAAEGDVRLMLPMVGAPEDLRRARALLAEASASLAREGVPHNPRVPRRDDDRDPRGRRSPPTCWRREVDFFSIGTNDLIQYAPRRRPDATSSWPTCSGRRIRACCASIDATVPGRPGAGHPRHDVRRDGGEATYTVLLLGLGLREFSLTPVVVPRVRRLIRAAHARARPRRSPRAASASRPPTKSTPSSTARSAPAAAPGRRASSRSGAGRPGRRIARDAAGPARRDSPVRGRRRRPESASDVPTSARRIVHSGATAGGDDSLKWGPGRGRKGATVVGAPSDSPSRERGTTAPCGSDESVA